VFAIGGSFLAPKDLVQAQSFEEITAICQNAREIVNPSNP